MANKVKRYYFPSTQIEIRNSVVDAIESGSIGKGESIPTMKSIAEANKCTMSTVYSAFKILTSEGYIHKDGRRYVATGPKRNIKTEVKELQDKEKRPMKKERIRKVFVRSDDVKSKIVELIGSGSYKPGDRIPTQRELCNQFGCSKGTAQRVTNSLVSEGYLKKGTYRGLQTSGFIVAEPGIKEGVVDAPQAETVVEKPVVGKPVPVHSIVHKAKRGTVKKGIEYRVVSSVPNVSVMVSPMGKSGFVIHVDEYKWRN